MQVSLIFFTFDELMIKQPYFMFAFKSAIPAFK